MEARQPSFRIGDAISFGWDRFKDNVGILLGTIAIAIAIDIGFLILSRGVNGGLAGVAIGLASWAVSVVIGMGVIRIALKITDGETPEIEDLFVFDINFVAYAVTSILFGIAVVLGLLFFIIPGIMIALAWGFYAWPIVDRGALVGESLTVSANITRGHRWHLMGYGIVLGLFNILGFITLVGWLITMPVSIIATAYVYRHLSGDPVTAGA
jgi:hypothetical protein